MNVADHEPKFDECESCANYMRLRICRRCDAGEHFDPADGPRPLDEIITDD